jgi:hypothetical protein
MVNVVIQGVSEDILVLVWEYVNGIEMLYYKISEEIGEDV